ILLPLSLMLAGCAQAPKPQPNYYEMGRQAMQDTLNADPDYQLCAIAARKMADQRVQSAETAMKLYPVDHVAENDMINGLKKRVSLNCYQGIEDRKAGKPNTSYSARKETLNYEQQLIKQKDTTKGQVMAVEFQDIILNGYQMGYENDPSF
ncbi:hypothetical protein, partial [Kluyvera sp. Awk 3]|uniref:hypothetical protein n=1 Tax=Kluyvera sp. Awk 3 TaxID=2963956 RepID=UPI00230308EB